LTFFEDFAPAFFFAAISILGKQTSYIKLKINTDLEAERNCQ
jgi:hypothetical protein